MPVVMAGHVVCGGLGCPCDPATGSPRARRRSGQRRCGKPHQLVFAQVRGHMEVQVGAYCKTVGPWLPGTLAGVDRARSRRPQVRLEGSSEKTTGLSVLRGAEAGQAAPG